MKKNIRKIFISIVIILLIISVLGFVWGEVFYVSFAEIDRVSTKGGTLDAVAMKEILDGPLATGVYYVYVVPSGTKIYKWSRNFTFHKKVFCAEEYTGIDLVWENHKLLKIHYEGEYIYHFENTCYPLRPATADSQVKIILSGTACECDQ